MNKTCRRAIGAACGALALLPLSLCLAAAGPARAQAGASGTQSSHDYPTTARVEYVVECIDDNGRAFVNMYKCSCVIDHIAAALPYDDFVEQSTFSRYATLGGEGGAEFRVDRAKAQTKKFRVLQASAYRECGMASPGAAN